MTSATGLDASLNKQRSFVTIPDMGIVKPPQPIQEIKGMLTVKY